MTTKKLHTTFCLVHRADNANLKFGSLFSTAVAELLLRAKFAIYNPALRPLSNLKGVCFCALRTI